MDLKTGTLVLLLCLYFNSPAQVDNDQWETLTAQVEDSIASGHWESARTLAEKNLPIVKAKPVDSVIALLYYAIAIGYYSENPSFGIVYLDSALNCSANTASAEFITRVYGAKNAFQRKIGQFANAKQSGLDGIDYSLEHDSIGLFMLVRNLSVTYRETGQIDSSLFFMLIADSIAREQQEVYQMYLTSEGIAKIYLEMRQYRKAEIKLKELLQITKTNMHYLMNTWFNLALANLGMQRIDSAEESFNKSLKYAYQIKDTLHLADVYSRLSGLYLEKNDFQKAQKYIDSSMYLQEFQSAQDILYRSKMNASKIYLALNHQFKAQEFALEAYQIGKSLDVEVMEAEALDLLADCYAESKEFQKAYYYAREYESIWSEVINEERLETIEELRTMYESREKELIIDELKKENKIQELILSRQQILIMTIVSGALLIIGLIYTIYRKSEIRTSQQKLLLEQRLLRTQMNPHFIFNAMASIQSFLLNHDSKNGVLYLSKFGELMRDILESSRNTYIPLSKEIDMINNYVDLEKARFNKSIELRIDTGDLEQTNILIPPMILQPFIENAFKHGFSKKKEGKINIHLTRRQDQLHVTIQDDGVGITEDAPIKEKSYAIKITRERLNAISSEKKSNFNVGNKVDPTGKIVGLLVSFQLPFKNLV